MTMSLRFLCSLCLAAACILSAGCIPVRESSSTPEDFADVQSRWTVGNSTFQQMQDSYGSPNKTLQTADGFHAQWLKQRTFIPQNTAYGNPNPVASFESQLNRPVYAVTITTALNAFFDHQGILTGMEVMKITP